MGGEVLIELPTVRTHSLVSLHIRRAALPPNLGLGRLRFVLVSVVVPDVTAQGVVGLELLLAVLAGVGEVLVELLEV